MLTTAFHTIYSIFELNAYESSSAVALFSNLMSNGCIVLLSYEIIWQSETVVSLSAHFTYYTQTLKI